MREKRLQSHLLYVGRVPSVNLIVIYFLIAEAKRDSITAGITLCIINKQVMMCLQYAFTTLGATKSHMLGL